jgi:carbonic anhydrase
VSGASGEAWRLQLAVTYRLNWLLPGMTIMIRRYPPRSVSFTLPALVAITAVGCKAKDELPPPPAPPAAAAEPPHWDYGVEHGPAAWGTLAGQYATCGTGQAQSPIDIVGAAPATSLPALAAANRPAALRIIHHVHKADVVNTGHSIQVSYTDGDTLTVGADKYALIQYHFHSPSEHQVRGDSFPMEMHLVHKSSDNRLAVVGVLIREGRANGAFDPVWSQLPATKGAEVVHDSVMVDVDDLLPRTRTSYRYDGSLTTPPCSEGVKWFVLTTPIELSASQIAAFRAVLVGNNRPVQPLNGRVIATDQVR